MSKEQELWWQEKENGIWNYYRVSREDIPKSIINAQSMLDRTSVLFPLYNGYNSINSFLKEFAGISYLTKEFGDRQIDGASLYLKNLNNITKEMQLEILKRDKLDYVFQSLSFIAIAPVLLITPLKNWAISSFGFTAQFYNGKGGLIVELLLLLLTIVCYILVRKVKDNGSIKDEYKDPNKVWQMKLYKNNFIKPIVDKFIPKKNTTEYRKNVKLMKEAAAKQKELMGSLEKLAQSARMFK